MTDTIVVFTAKSADRITREGGTSSWRLDRSNARRCTYAVCVRNAHSSWGEGVEDHHVAFLIGKISGVVPTGPTPDSNESPKDRYLVQFSEYAKITVPDAWPKGYRNPVRYTSIDDLGIDLEMLDWQAMPSATEAPTPEELEPPVVERRTETLTIADAKRGLALTFGVPPEAVEITIRG